MNSTSTQPTDTERLQAKNSTSAQKKLADRLETPNRFNRPSAFTFVILVLTAALLIHGWTQGVALHAGDMIQGIGRLGSFFTDALPPDTERLGPILSSLLLTFEMALLGTIIGVILSLPLAVLAAQNTSPHRSIHLVSRGFITICRTIPDLVWALIFVIAVGLGPQAGVLAIAVDVMGFCGRFFADAIEEMDPGAAEGLEATGAPKRSVILGAIFPSILPSIVATSMFALEQATRSSVVLGLVGAGGIGVELNVSMTLMRYDEALMIILAIFVVVFIVERLSAAIRRRILKGNL